MHIKKDQIRGTWYFVLDAPKENGKRKQIRRTGFKTKRAAEQKYRQFKQEIEESGTFKIVSDISFNDYLDYFIKNYMEVNLKESTVQNKLFLIEKHIRPVLKNYKLREITPAIINEIINNKVKEGYKKKYISSIFTYIKLIFRYSVFPSEFLKKNPAEHLKMPKIEDVSNAEKSITMDNLNKLIKLWKNTKFNIVYTIGLHTGMRLGEIIALEWDNIDLNKGVITVNKNAVTLGSEVKLSSPKTQSSIRTINIGKTLILELKKWRVGQIEQKFKRGKFYIQSNFVCTYSDGRWIKPNSIKSNGTALKKKYGIKFNFHMLRHTHATMLIENGANMKDVQERLGHYKYSTTMDTYAHVTKKMSDETIEIFEKVINQN